MITPRKGFTKKKIKERSLLRRTLEFIPIIGTGLFYSRGKYTKFEYDHKEISALKHLYHSAIVVSLGAYLLGGVKTGNWRWEDYNKDFETRQKNARQIDSTYNAIINENIDDTTFINQLNKYVPFSEKEKVVKENNLEKDLE